MALILIVADNPVHRDSLSAVLSAAGQECVQAGDGNAALALASRSPCDPRTLTRAARDMVEKQPAFSMTAGLLALRWLVEGYGYDITGADVWAAYSITVRAAERAGVVDETRERIRDLVAGESAGGFVRQILGKELAL